MPKIVYFCRNNNKIMNLEINFTQIASAFVVLFALIDILGNTPIILDFKVKGKDINPFQSSFYALIIMTAFLFVGEAILALFGVDIPSFAVAGALVIFIISIEMIFGIEVFKNDAPNSTSTFVPIVFPLLAGPGTFTALLSMRAEYSIPNILIALLANMIIVFIVLRKMTAIQRIIGNNGAYVLRKFFGIILMAISVKLFTSNISTLINNIQILAK